MLRRLLPASLSLLGLFTAAALASERVPPTGPASAAPALTQQADNAPASPGAEAVPAPALAPEFAERLATDGKLSAADRADRSALAKFYESRRSEPVWMSPKGLSPAAAALVAEFGKADDWGLDAADYRLPTLPAAGPDVPRAQQVEAEVAIGLALLKYARHARGGRIDPASLSKYMDRKPPLADPAHVLDEASRAAAPDAYLRGLHPQHAQFDLLRQKYLALKREQPAAKAEPATSSDSSKGKKKAAPVPEGPSLRKLHVNMEQWRWMPEDLGRYYVWVNIPEFMLRIVKDGKVVHSERVIVGKVDTQTPIFSDAMEQVIFHPFWGVPDSIKKYEILPSLARGNTRILERHNLRIQRGGRDINPESVDWASTDIRNFHVYQPPGGGNVLGVVKFRFPNKHDVYMHDTPTKNLFNANVRAFSHGCMRVRDPERLAELLLAEDKGWPASRIAAAINGGPQNNHVNLSQKFPVHITYFTAAVDDGKLKLYGDLYGHESKIALGMEGKAHLIARWKEDRAPVRAEPVGRLAETKADGQKDWMRRAFGN